MEDSFALQNRRMSLGNMPVIVEENNCRFRIFWVRIIYGHNESLLTMNARHTVYEIEYIIQHSMTVRLGDGTDIQLGEGQFLIVPPGTAHQIIESHPDGIKFIMGFQAEHLVKPTAYDWIKIPACREAGPLIPSLLHTLELACQQAPCPSGWMNSLFSIILSVFLSPAPPAQGSRDMVNEQRYQDFLSYIQLNNGIGISVEESARYLNISPRQLNRICIQQSGCSPKEIIAEKKLSYICSCLRNTPMSLIEIADISGFQTEYAMTKFCRRYLNMTPSQYRRKYFEENAHP